MVNFFSPDGSKILYCFVLRQAQDDKTIKIDADSGNTDCNNAQAIRSHFDKLSVTIS